MAHFVGSKSGQGVYQTIINQMPPHDVYIEPFLGLGAVMRRKLPARHNVGLDVDDDMVQRAADLVAAGVWVPQPCSIAGSGAAPWFRFEKWDALDYLGGGFDPDALVYCDPPYLVETRRCQRRYYRRELSVVQHRELLGILCRLPNRVLISGYDSPLYAELLASWRVVRYGSMTRMGPRVECLWLNYPEPTELHDYRYLGRDYRERLRIRRKLARWSRRLDGLPVLEREALLSALRTRRE